MQGSPHGILLFSSPQPLKSNLADTEQHRRVTLQITIRVSDVNTVFQAEWQDGDDYAVKEHLAENSEKADMIVLTMNTV
jgi:hypothetical protein